MLIVILLVTHLLERLSWDPGASIGTHHDIKKMLAIVGKLKQVMMGVYWTNWTSGMLSCQETYTYDELGWEKVQKWLALMEGFN